MNSHSELVSRVITQIVAITFGLLPLIAFAGTDTCSPQQVFIRHAPESQNATGPYAKGMLWKAARPGTSASYLFGTMHLSNLFYRLPPAVALALAKADRFITEAILDRSDLVYYQQHMLSNNPPNLGSMFKPPFRTRLVRLLMNYGFDRQTALKLKPWAAFTLLSRPKPTGAATLDQVLEETARQQGKPIKGLQPIEELVSALEGIPLAQQREIVLDAVCNRGLIERQERELVVRYLNQDLAGMLAVSRRYEPRDPAIARTFEKRLLLDRNQRMLKRLQTYLKHGNAFVAVGALHLAGRKGLLSGLAARGYRVTPIHY